MLRPARALALVLTGCSVLLSAGAQAQGLRPPLGLPGDAPDYTIQPAQAQDAASLTVRIDRLEGQLRTQNGQIEDMQFRIKRLEDQLRKFQEDVDFRFQESAGRKPGARPTSAPPTAPAPAKRTELNEGGYPIVGEEAPVDPPLDAPAHVATGGKPARHSGDAFDPDADPAAPGAPRQLGETPSPSVPPRQVVRRAGPAPPLDPAGDDGIIDNGGAPMDLHGPSATPVIGGGAPPTAPRVISGLEPAGLSAAPPAVATPRAEFDAAVATLRAGQFDAAETAFRNFLQAHPKDRLSADATFYLGESFYRRSRAREAAEQYLKVSTDFDKSTRAPEALLKLGLSLEKLGAREQACAAYGEVGRKYPTASASIKASADRESKRAQC